MLDAYLIIALTILIADGVQTFIDVPTGGI